ncbi:MAG TPA: hypothetical protein PKL84_11040, partial [Candidatus Hydrogenedentes bacterium]|nr:hypothetical protein [Candidatus Hydrogenedentota bacterium]
LPWFKRAIASDRKAPHRIVTFTNGHMLHIRHAGYQGVNFQGMHVDAHLVDEAAEMTEKQWRNLAQSLNEPGIRFVYGVPNGLLSTFYRISHDPGYEQYNWPSTLNPAFTPEKKAELEVLYGGLDSPGFVHNVLGKHGRPLHAVFSLDLPCWKHPNISPHNLGTHDFIPNSPDPINAWPESPENYPCYIGADLGFAQDPSIFTVYHEIDGTLVNFLNIGLSHVPYPVQQSILIALINNYSPEVIAIDAGHSGLAVGQALSATQPDIADKIELVNFASAVIWDNHGRALPVKRQVKELLTEILLRHMHDGTILFNNEPERFRQYAKHTFAYSPSGRIIYSKGDDHIIDADRLAVYAYHRAALRPIPETPHGIAVGFFDAA